MAGTDRHESQIYQLRAVLRGISSLVWRRLLVRGDSTGAQLHEVLQIAFGWDDEHLNRFEILGREYAVYREGSLPQITSLSYFFSGNFDAFHRTGTNLKSLVMRPAFVALEKNTAFLAALLARKSRRGQVGD
jgi:hypothetical protein